MQEDQIDLIIEDAPRRGGVSLAVIVSVILHTLLITYVVLSYHPVSNSDPAPPMAHFVQLIRQNPRQFTEAPGPKVDSAPLTAPWSDANRRASTPHPTGDRPTNRPGEGGLYTPGSTASTPRPPGSQATPEINQQASRPSPSTANAADSTSTAAARATDTAGGTFAYRPPTQGAQAAGGAINWKSAIREVGKVASLGGNQQSMDLGNAGGEKGYARDGPISFESQWYDWGAYAESMVSRIRVNWYSNMPQLIQTGLKGVVTIRFTIHHDGRISDVTILNSSDVPPYDFAAKKAIELSSPLNPLPADFPNATEHVTAMFFYNQEPPRR